FSAYRKRSQVKLNLKRVLQVTIIIMIIQHSTASSVGGIRTIQPASTSQSCLGQQSKPMVTSSPSPPVTTRHHQQQGHQVPSHVRGGYYSSSKDQQQRQPCANNGAMSQHHVTPP
ncbi:unnamed protein product, partial [Amoebophrya sp. A25]